MRPNTIAGGRKRSVRDRCKTWVETMMADGPQVSATLEELGKTMGFSKNTLQRVKEELGLKSKQTYNADGLRVWYWVKDLNDPLPETKTILEPEVDEPNVATSMSQTDIVNTACDLFAGRAMACGDPLEYNKKMLYGEPEENTRGVLEDLIETVRESPNGNRFSKEKIEALMYQGLEAAIADVTLSKKERSRLSSLRSFKPKQPEQEAYPFS